MTTELPLELWASILGHLEDIQDLFCLQLASKSFYSIVLQTYWTKVKRIDIQTIPLDPGGLLCLQVNLDTIPKKKLLLPIREAALPLGKLAEKATKITSVAVDFKWMPWIDSEERFSQIFSNFFDALLANEVQLKEFKLTDFNPAYHQYVISQSVVGFLRANTESLTSLIVKEAYPMRVPILEGLIPDELFQSFRDCLSLENVEIVRAERFMESILQEKDQLKSLSIDYNLPASFLQSGARVQYLCCKLPTILDAYVLEVTQQNRSTNHPLHSLNKLEVQYSGMMRTLPWAHFPNLQLLILRRSIMGHMVELVQSYLMQWTGTDEEKALECWLEHSWGNTEIMTGIASRVETACGCQARVTGADDGSRGTIVFEKGDVTVKILIQKQLPDIM